MNKKKIILVIMLVLFAIVLDIVAFKLVFKRTIEDRSLIMRVSLVTDTQSVYKSNYTVQGAYYEGNMSAVNVSDLNQEKSIDLAVKYSDTYSVYLGQADASIAISKVEFVSGTNSTVIPLLSLMDGKVTEEVDDMEMSGDKLLVKVKAGFPSIEFKVNLDDMKSKDMDKLRNSNLIYSIIISVLVDLVVLFVILNISVIASLYRNIRYDRKLILSLAKNDFKTRFAGSYFGIVWAIIQPLITILVYWFVFQVGLRSQNMSSYPFVLWLMCGMVPWFYFSEALSSGTNALTEYSYLVKKVVFKIEVLPIVKVLSALVVNLFFVAFIIVVLACYGYMPDLYTIQILYYIVCNIALALSLSYLTSAVVVFFKDLGQIIGILLQIGVWITPILWDASIVSAKLDRVLKINPVYYIVSGFRDALLTKQWVFSKGLWTLMFWCTVVVLYVLGRKVFEKLQPHFADVL